MYVDASHATTLYMYIVLLHCDGPALRDLTGLHPSPGHRYSRIIVCMFYYIFIKTTAREDRTIRYLEVNHKIKPV